MCYFSCMNEQLKCMCMIYFCELVKISCIPKSTVAAGDKYICGILRKWIFSGDLHLLNICADFYYLFLAIIVMH